MYGVISPPKFKLLYATLLLSINAGFFNPIFDFYNSTLCIDNSTSIFQNAIFNFYNSTFHIDNSTFKLCIMIVRYVCIAIQHSCFTSSQTKSHILNSTFLPLHATFVYFTATLMLGVCDARCRVRYACSTMQHSLDIERLSEPTLRW